MVQGVSLKERLVEQSFVNASESLFYDNYEGDELCSYGEGVFGGKNGKLLYLL